MGDRTYQDLLEELEDLTKTSGPASDSNEDLEKMEFLPVICESQLPKRGKLTLLITNGGRAATSARGGDCGQYHECLSG